MLKVTVIMSVYTRYKTLDIKLKAWLAQPEVDEILIWDNSRELLKTWANWDSRINIFTSSEHYHDCGARDMLCSLAKNDIVCIVDDDLIVEEGYIADLLQHYDGNSLIGIWGRRFDKDYKSGFESNNEFRADKIKEPKEVEFVVGTTLLTHRKNILSLGFPVVNYKKTCCDVHLSGLLKRYSPEVKKLIVPTSKWHLTEEECEAGALNQHPDALREKQELFEEYYALQR